MGESKGSRHTNSKTILSFDVTTICPKVRAGNPCVYCYVETGRKNKCMAKKIIDRAPYDGWVNKLRPDMVRRLNAVGGVRMFSFGDYMKRDAGDIYRFLTDCDLIGLRAKAITKSLEFVRKFHQYTALRTIHISIDNLKSGGSQITHGKAQEYRDKFAKVQVRAVCLDQEDLDYFGSCRWVDILTLNHAMNGFHVFTKKERIEAGLLYPGRVCCVSGECQTCTVKCGITREER